MDKLLLLCKKAYDESLFEIGKYYKITNEVKSGPGIYIHDVLINRYWFSMIKKEGGYPYVFDYFHDKNSERKIKLQFLKFISKIKV